MIPVHDSNPTRRTPWVTYLLIGVNVAVFLVTPVASVTGLERLSLGERCELHAFFERYGAIPEELVSNRQLPQAATGQAGYGPAGPGCVVTAAWYDKIPALSVLFSMFLHGGWLHLLGNMLFLGVFGNNVEDRFGRLKFLLFYLVAGYLAGYGYALANAGSTAPLVGASGAVSGVLGAYLVLFPRVKVWSLVPVLLFIPLRLPAWLVLGLWFVLQWAYSTGYAVADAGSVAYLAHVIGFLVGLAVAVPLLARRRPGEYDAQWEPRHPRQY